MMKIMLPNKTSAAAKGQADEPAKPFWQSTNFYIALILAVGGLFVGFPEDAARELVGQVFALIASGAAIRNWAKNAGKPVIARLGGANFWNYVATVVLALVPAFPPEMFDALQQLAANVIGQNWQGVIMAVFSIATIVYKIVTAPKPPVTEPDPKPAL